MGGTGCLSYICLICRSPYFLSSILYAPFFGSIYQSPRRISPLSSPMDTQILASWLRQELIKVPPPVVGNRANLSVPFLVATAQ